TVGQTPPAPVITVKGDTLTCSHASGYQWYYNGAPIGGATDSFYVALQGGIYAVLIYDSIGCSRQSIGVSVSVNEISEQAGIRIFPNPADNQITILDLRFTIEENT